jgi:hypothetical protein
MEKHYYEEMEENIKKIDSEIHLENKGIFLFGHCNSSLELKDLLENNGFSVAAILDNSSEKQVLDVQGVEVKSPDFLCETMSDNTVVLITSRFYPAMVQQLRELGYEGPIRKVIDYNTYADYTLSEDTIARMTFREKHGEDLLKNLSEKYPRSFKVFCPFNALGDIYFMISYWKSFAKKRSIEEVVFCVPGKALREVIHMFGDYHVAVYEQKELDAMIQAALYLKDSNSFIAHQDRPYVISLSKALYIKKIPLEDIYCCGVYGLPLGTEPDKPIADKWEYKDLENIPKGKAVIFSPYAKSVIALSADIWTEAVKYYNGEGYKCYTNVFGDEKPLEGTEPISPSILEIRSVVERAGTFIGIRSGLCDILREAKAKKIALYPDYNYCDTKWKAIEMYHISQFDHNLLATEEIEWKKL